MKLIRLAMALVAGLVLMTPATVSAAPVSAFEFIEDLMPIDPFGRDLRRTRDSVGTGTVVENVDATIIAGNNVDLDFGILNSADVSYQHNMNWVVPPVGTYLLAQLSITAFGSLELNGPETVFVDTVNIGNLTFNLGFQTTVFGGAAILTGLVADGLLNIVIDKNAGCQFICLNAVSITGSRLDIRYEPVASVPEPATLALLGGGLTAAATRLRRRVKKA